MKTSEQTDKIMAALVTAQSEIAGAEKGGFNDFLGYNYSTLEDYLRVVKPVMAKHRMAISFGSRCVKQSERRTRGKVTRKNSDNGKGSTQETVEREGKIAYHTLIELTMRIMHESGQWLELTGTAEGEDHGDKGLSKAITVGRRYLLACAFNIFTDDDPEKDRKTDRDAVDRGAKVSRNGRAASTTASDVL